ncbi:rna-directed dna polymerase from mobile element jockey-like [Limosa lapponica baueri]|uniref:Rna-directed dna polymerase from mobile element jockey-like n=1 Tax=Limosa lapponica baueri TaxID=1758121 RepID=A0A2I0TT14_LIMLA|nr:rna-directed dna polymerase from mobile element jockey-like [Limosa lapponica baueri]
MSYEKQLRTLGSSGLKRRRLRGDLMALYSFLRRGSGEGGADVFYLGSRDTTHQMLAVTASEEDKNLKGLETTECSQVHDEIHHKPDGSHPRVLKELQNVMVGHLSIICKRSWKRGDVPADWKLASVIPVYKKVMREDPGNHRPVTCLVDEGKAVDVFFLDFSKAFHTVSHSILLDKLSSCEMSRYMVRWVKNCLNGKAQRVVVNGWCSNMK